MLTDWAPAEPFLRVAAEADEPSELAPTLTCRFESTPASTAIAWAFASVDWPVPPGEKYCVPDVAQLDSWVASTVAHWPEVWITREPPQTIQLPPSLLVGRIEIRSPSARVAVSLVSEKVPVVVAGMLTFRLVSTPPLRRVTGLMVVDPLVDTRT